MLGGKGGKKDFRVLEYIFGKKLRRGKRKKSTIIDTQWDEREMKPRFFSNFKIFLWVLRVGELVLRFSVKPKHKATRRERGNQGV